MTSGQTNVVISFQISLHCSIFKVGLPLDSQRFLTLYMISRFLVVSFLVKHCRRLNPSVQLQVIILNPGLTRFQISLQLSEGPSTKIPLRQNRSLGPHFTNLNSFYRFFFLHFKARLLCRINLFMRQKRNQIKCHELIIPVITSISFPNQVR